MHSLTQGLFGFVFVAVVLGSHALAQPPSSAPNLMKFKVFPNELFIGERAPINFEVQPLGGAMDGRAQGAGALVIAEVTVQPDVIPGQPAKLTVFRNVGLLTDEGVAGDKRRGDGILARKFTFEEREPGIHTFAVFQDGAFSTPLSEPAVLTILARPTLTAILQTAWAKFKARF